MRKYIFPITSVGLIIVIAILLISRDENTAMLEPVNNEPINIGFVGPLTGGAAVVGIPNRATVDYVAERINSTGGIHGRPVNLIIEDGECDAKKAVTVGKKLIDIDHVNYIIGGMCSGESIAIAPLADAAGVVMISAASSHPSLTDAGDYFFRDYPSDNFQGQVAAEYILNDLHTKKVAIVATNYEYSQGIKASFKKSFTGSGGVIVYETDVSVEDRDFRSVITKLKSADVELLYLPMLMEQGLEFLTQMRELGLDVPVFTTEEWNNADVVPVHPAAEGVYLTAIHTQELPDDIRNGILSKCVDCTIAPGVPQAYDALNILAQTIERVGDDPEKVKDALYETDYQGLSGRIQFDSNGDLLNATYVIKQVQDGAFKTISE